MLYGYARVSTKGQARDGNSLEEQEQRLKKAGAGVIFMDSYTGKSMDRPEFDKLLAALQDGDTLIVTKLDRIARSASKGSELVQSLIDAGVRVNVLNMGMLDNSPTGKLMMNVMFAFAEFERDMIIERTREGKEIARQSPDYREGRPKVNVSEGEFKKFLKKQKRGEITVDAACESLSISRSTWYNLARKVVA